MSNRSIFLISLFILNACAHGEPKEANEQLATNTGKTVPVEVKIKRLEYKDFNYELISNGKVSALNKANLQFKSQETIGKIYVRSGQQVVKGQKIAELDKFKLTVVCNQAREAFDRATLDLQDVLIGQGYRIKDSAQIPGEVMKIAKIRSNYEQSLNNYVMAKHNLDAAVLYAPFTGVVANLTEKEHNLAPNAPFCTIIGNQNTEAVFFILENELPFVHLGDKVFVAPFAEPNYSSNATISEINPQVDKNGMIRVKCLIKNNSNKLLEGMNVKIRIQRLWSKQLIVPKSAVVLRSNRKVVFTFRNNKALWNYIETTQENSESYLVTQGLNPGDSIIYDGNFNLAHEAIVVLSQ